MAPPSKSQIDRLGARLRSPGVPSADDLALVQQYIASHGGALESVRAVVADIGYGSTGRLKTIDTLIDKLRRTPLRLSSVQDLAGARLDAVADLDDQDRTVEVLRRRFHDCRVVDRRDTPSNGYRAVHIVASVHERFVEIQVRTVLQDLWAQAFERLADRLGRQIRYGGAPSTDHPVDQRAVEALVEFGAELAVHEQRRQSLVAGLQRIVQTLNQA